MPKELSPEALAERNEHLVDDIIRLADENASLTEQVKTLTKELADAREISLSNELDAAESGIIAEQIENKFENLKYTIRDFGGHTPTCCDGAVTGRSLHPSCTCGWNFYATEIERESQRSG
jgi:hypothetical protein